MYMRAHTHAPWEGRNDEGREGGDRHQDPDLQSLISIKL